VADSNGKAFMAAARTAHRSPDRGAVRTDKERLQTTDYRLQTADHSRGPGRPETQTAWFTMTANRRPAVAAPLCRGAGWGSGNGTPAQRSRDGGTVPTPDIF
jgi:hypothetical protein